MFVYGVERMVQMHSVNNLTYLVLIENAETILRLSIGTIIIIAF